MDFQISKLPDVSNVPCPIDYANPSRACVLNTTHNSLVLLTT